MSTHINTTRLPALILAALMLSAIQPMLTAQNLAPAAARAEAQKTAVLSAAYNIPGAPRLPIIIPYYDVKAYAWVWDTPTQTWRLIPRNEARIFDGTSHSPKKQLIGTLLIDGNYDVPAVPGNNVTLLFRMNTDFKTFDGLPSNESGFEVTQLAIRDGYKKGQLIRTAFLQRRGQSAATFGAAREPISVQKITRQDGVFHVVHVDRPLAPGRYALYLPDRAFEFAVR